MGRVRAEWATAPDVPLTAQFESAVIPLLEPLYRQALRMTSNRVDAEDLVQDTMLNAYIGFRAFEPGTNVEAWLRRIMTNTHINGYRRQKRRPAQHLSGEITDRQLAASAPRTPGGLRSAEDQALELLPDRDLKAAMMGLPEQFRIVVYFADIAGYSYKEIAAMTDTQQGTVSSRLNRGRKQLRELLFDSAVDHAPRMTDTASVRGNQQHPAGADHDGSGAASCVKGKADPARSVHGPPGALTAVCTDPRREGSGHGRRVHVIGRESKRRDE
ncbi:sigma-70 family RNA polymerase sigma factor [Mycobacterium sp. E3251]|uniref:sigma-70 family RNA polymerase sigma factor n=1 Tax=Mycobacterium sp. E3251 TaxID=1834144 RepID=UPI000B1D0085